MSANRTWLALVASLIMALLCSWSCGGGGNTTGFTGGGTEVSATSPNPSSTGEIPTSTTNVPTTSMGTDGMTEGVNTGETSASSSSTQTSDPSTSSTTDTSGDLPCPQGEIICEGDTAKTCDGMDGFSGEENCSNVCAPGLGCVLCVPGYQCVNGNSQKCSDDGQNWEDKLEVCDGVQGIVCNDQTGQCEGSCAKKNLGTNYIGCEYYPTVSKQIFSKMSLPGIDFAIAASNTGDAKAMITVERNGMLIVESFVEVDGVEIIILPWVEELVLGNGPSQIVEKGAYHLRSDQPLTLYQYNPLEGGAGSNDASLLLPVNVWTGDYVVASRESWSLMNWKYPGFYNVVAMEDNTQVTLISPTSGALIQAGAGVQVDGSGMIQLNQGDVLEVITALDGVSDLTGAFVHANKPVQVLAGHASVMIPKDVETIDHLEESMFPIQTLGKEYVVVPPVQSPDDSLKKGQIIRIIATADNTNLAFTPDQQVNKLLAKGGDFVEIPITTEAFQITGNNKILVAQYMLGYEAGYGDGDPAMVLAITPQQWRQEYLVHASTSWDNNYANLTAKNGTTVMVDGVQINNWKSITGTGYSFTHAKLSNEGNGNHTITGNSPVEVSVYGLKSSGSYWYPGGLDLNLIPQ